MKRKHVDHNHQEEKKNMKCVIKECSLPSTFILGCGHGLCRIHLWVQHVFEKDSFEKRLCYKCSYDT